MPKPFEKGNPYRFKKGHTPKTKIFDEFTDRKDLTRQQKHYLRSKKYRESQLNAGDGFPKGIHPAEKEYMRRNATS